MKPFTFVVCTTAILLFACGNDKKIAQSNSAESDTTSLMLEKEDGVFAAAEGIVFPSPGEFHKMLARSNGTWTGAGTMRFSADSDPVSSGASTLVNKMAMDGLYQVSEVKGSPAPGMGAPWTGLRITGYDNARKVFTRAMIGDGATNGVVMEGLWDEATRSITMPFKQIDRSTGKEHSLKEVYKIIDEDTEVLEIYGTDPKTGKEFKMLNVTWTRMK